MQITIPTATDLAVENESATQYAATIHGQRWSGITENSNMWASVQKALTDGAIPAPYVAPPVPNPALIELAKLDGDVDRVTEDLVDVLVAKGVITMDDLPAPAVTKINRKKELRAPL